MWLFSYVKRQEPSATPLHEVIVVHNAVRTVPLASGPTLHSAVLSTTHWLHELQPEYEETDFAIREDVFQCNIEGL